MGACPHYHVAGAMWRGLSYHHATNDKSRFITTIHLTHSHVQNEPNRVILVTTIKLKTRHFKQTNIKEVSNNESYDAINLWRAPDHIWQHCVFHHHIFNQTPSISLRFHFSRLLIFLVENIFYKKTLFIYLFINK